MHETWSWTWKWLWIVLLESQGIGCTFLNLWFVACRSPWLLIILACIGYGSVLISVFDTWNIYDGPPMSLFEKAILTQCLLWTVHIFSSATISKYWMHHLHSPSKGSWSLFCHACACVTGIIVSGYICLDRPFEVKELPSLSHIFRIYLLSCVLIQE